MLPKIASALARVLDPIKPIDRPGQSVSTAKAADSSGGGYGPSGYESQSKAETPPEAGPDLPSSEPLAEDGLAPRAAENHLPGLPLQSGLTQVILDLNSHRIERSAESAAQTYETGAKDQKKNARLPKGSMLDKKVG